MFGLPTDSKTSTLLRKSFYFIKLQDSRSEPDDDDGRSYDRDNASASKKVRFGPFLAFPVLAFLELVLLALPVLALLLLA